MFPFMRRIASYPVFLSRQLRAWRQDLWILGIAALLGVAFMIPYTMRNVPPGSVGVEWKRFAGGTVIDEVYGEGARFILPWNKFFVYDTRIQSGDNVVSALSADGLQVEVDLAWVFHLMPETAGIVHKAVGPDYRDKVIVRVIESVVRDRIALFRSEEMHTPERATFEKNVFAGVKDALSRYSAINRLDPNYVPPEGDNLSLGKGLNWVNLEAMLIKEVRFPPAVQEAYIRKNTARALVEEYKFRIAVEQMEVERKMVEALGIRNFQEVVDQSLSEPYLRWKTLEAYVATARSLAQSPNAKLVVMGPGTGVGGGAGTGAGGVPLILNTSGLDSMPQEAKDAAQPGAAAANPQARAKAAQGDAAAAPKAAGPAPAATPKAAGPAPAAVPPQAGEARTAPPPAAVPPGRPLPESRQPGSADGRFEATPFARQVERDPAAGSPR
jgi:regulator of protease activity HflC (stomatin/prohibitin superfamily)